MNKIIVVCTGNTCRSPMAEGIINKIIEDNNIKDVVVSSMGLSAQDGEEASAYAIDVLNEIDIDIKNHRSQILMLKDLYEADCIYVMTLQHKNVILEACDDDNIASIEQKIVVMDIADPFGQDITKYRETRDMMLDYFNRELNG